MASGGFFDAGSDGVQVGAADFVIVGSGAGGGTAARVLAGAGHSVAVLEEGPPFSREQAGVVAADTMARYFRNRGQMAALGRAPMPILQGRCVGGTTVVNSAIIWRLPDPLAAAWRALGLGDMLPEEGLGRAYEQIESEMHVRAVTREIAGRQDLLMRVGAERAGIAHRPIRRSEIGCQGSGRCMHGCPHDAKQSTAVNFLRRAAGDGATIHAHARVERVHLSAGRAVAVTGRVDPGSAGPRRGRPFRVEARRAVIVSASVIQSPVLLHRSGVRGEALGEHFMAHPGTSVSALYPDPVHMWSGASQGYEATGLRESLGIKLESINVPPEVTAARFPGAGRRLAAYLERINHLASWAVAVRMDAQGCVRPSRLFGGARVHYTPTESDIRRIRAGMKRCAEMHFLAGASEVLTGVHGLPEVLTSADQLALYDQASLDPRAYHMVATHLFGTCRAGVDPRTSVVDPHLRVHGTEGLYVMDASVFPGNTGVNPQHSIMVISMIAAGRLAAA